MNYLIIGGVAGGATVAARLRRMDEKANVILFERGKYVSYANCGLPYYIGDTINKPRKAVRTDSKRFHRPFSGLTFALEQEVTAIRPIKKEAGNQEPIHRRDIHRNIRQTGTFTGSRTAPAWYRRDRKQENIHARNVPDTDTIKNYVNTENRNVLIVVGWRLYRTGNGGKSVRLRYPGRRGGNGQIVMAPLDFSMAAIVHRQLDR